jgi:hypothetical protein
MHQDLPGLMAEASAIAADAERIFGSLTPPQLNWKPDASRWSVAQCFEHLIKINAEYFPQFRRIEDGKYERTWRDRATPLSRAFASLVLKAVQPASQRKYKAASHVLPSASAIDGTVIARFTAHQREVIDHMQALAAHDIGALVIPSPVAPIVFYSVVDALRIIVVHERRHMAQAERVTTSPGFPQVSRTAGA